MRDYSTGHRLKTPQNFSLSLFVFLSFASEIVLASPFDGVWIGTATSPNSNCASADINIVVDGTQINGSAIDTTFFEVFAISGNVNSNGTISNGAFAIGDQGTAANFAGTFTSSSANGSWNSTDGCFGTFELTLIASYDSGFHELWNGNLITTSGELCGSGGTLRLTVYKGLDFEIRGHVLTSFNEYLAFIGNTTGNSFSGVAGSFNLTFGSFSGSFSGDNSSGTWSDVYGCAGTFEMSLALRNPDTDNDGFINSLDIDDDGDGVNDDDDALPLDSSETLDTDNDGTGNNSDVDDDNDGINDSSDIFPLDGNESLDSDRDGTGDNADTDDDNDQMSDTDEILVGRNPVINEPAVIQIILNEL